MNVSEALEFYGLDSLEGLTANGIKKLERQAAKRWHPDKIAHSNPDEETRKRYEASFRLLKEAADCLRAAIRGGYGAEVDRDRQEAEREARMRATAPTLLEDLKAWWPVIKKKRLGRSIEEIVLREGRSIAYWMSKVDGRAWRKTAAGAFVGFLNTIFLGMAMIALGNTLFSSDPHIKHAIGDVVGLYMLVGPLVALIWALIISLPLWEVWWKWDFQKMLRPVKFYCDIFNLGLVIPYYNLASAAVMYLMSVGLLLLWSPIWLVLSMLKNKKIGTIKQRVIKFGSLSQEQVESLLKKQTDELSYMELVWLDHLDNVYRKEFEKA